MDAILIKQDGQYNLSGELSFQSVPILSDRIHGMIDDSVELIINLANVTHTDSAGVAMLIDWVHSARQQGKVIHFLNIPAQMRAIAQVSGVDEVLPLSSN